MSDKLKLSDLNSILKDLDVESLEGVTIEGDIELDIQGGGGMNPAMAYALGHEAAQISLHVANIARMLGYPVDQLFAQCLGAGGETAALQAEPAIEELMQTKFDVARSSEWNTPIQEVTLGATSADGGSRGHTITLGGEKAMPFYFDAEMPNRNYVTMDVFDMPISMAKSVKSNYEDVMGDPAEWAKKVVNEYNADMVTIHLISTDPLINDTPAKEAAKVVEDVLQAVDVPIVIGGSGNPQKDPEVLEKAAEVAEGERALLASASLNLDYERVAKAATDYGHAVLSWTQLEINAQKELNRKLMKQCNVPRDSIVMDPTTAALGYGLDYAYSNMERIRLSALMGDDELNFPMSSGTTNAWGARESWMKESPLKEDSDWGPREYRGPIWEIVTGLSLALAGNDMFMMMHPTSVQVLKEITQTLYGNIEAKTPDITNWITAEV
ncbi:MULTISPECIES: CO dehydrogenase/acetyl-CoA synthase subunit delta [Methanohalophilus]|uniref:Acetyl-CoA decarbonylase/synthase complex subunit delta n=2 Tax=Methanohalophilus portucalensis TaxID=39664 RepID=A0A1L9C3N7_9EURY|nr:MULTISPECIES: CO dehydrogenase/acetyl-CoA synthase subunit delta [Methanohalophilus]ATU07995.1 CO dehydrogenase/acetyl-CoA synthase subunit delta [Methanohalophilus portucalensis]OJH49155.1 acetyl-CoA decarbonylase/synthase subunit delta [Methanohalophilus portucalensis FDF-1]RNI11713.1 CO dehydrogenase/acetyl-CoA synthase subunit delta [Methanohalophilus portucalensis FDF-1]RNI12494.1 CO dehydrogenase/acetyl-CoA synthase subunit delta [Methanohalophilus sp. RSK]SMH42799.1 acetyl-CoA decarb